MLGQLVKNMMAEYKAPEVSSLSQSLNIPVYLHRNPTITDHTPRGSQNISLLFKALAPKSLYK